VVPVDSVRRDVLEDGSTAYAAEGVAAKPAEGTVGTLAQHPIFGVVGEPHNFAFIFIAAEPAIGEDIDYFIYGNHGHWVVAVLESGEMLDAGGRVPEQMHSAFEQAQSLHLANADLPLFRLEKAKGPSPVD
jgi:hypothetical protein